MPFTVRTLITLPFLNTQKFIMSQENTYIQEHDEEIHTRTMLEANY